MLELVERLADLQIKRKRVLELQDSSGSLLRGFATYPGMQERIRSKAKVYAPAAKILRIEIERVELLIEKELTSRD